MWQIILLSTSFASLGFVVAEDLRHERPVSYSLSSLIRPTRNLDARNVEVPLIRPQSSLSNCPSVETLENILVLLKRLFNQDGNSYDLQPDKKIQVLHSLKEYLERSDSHIDNLVTIKDLINRTDKSLPIDDDGSHQVSNNENDKNHIEAKFIFKYDLPRINDIGCKEALATLIQTVKHAHLQMINYCNQSNKCKLNFQESPTNIQLSNSNNIRNLDASEITRFNIIPSNPNSLNNYDVQSLINNLGKTKNVMLNGPVSNDYLNSRDQLQLQDVNSKILKTPNIQEKNIDVYNSVYLNKEVSQSNLQQSDKSNVLNSFLSFPNPLLSQAQLSPASPYPLNTYNVQSPLNDLAMTQNKDILIQGGSNGYLNDIGQESFLNTNQFLTNSAFNNGDIQTKNIDRKQNFDVSNNNGVNIFGNNVIKTLNTHANGIEEFEAINNPLTLSKIQDVNSYVPNYNNELNQQQQLQRVYPAFDNTVSLEAANNNNYNNNEQGRLVHYESVSIPNNQHNNLNYLINPSDMKHLASRILMPSNQDVNFDKLQNYNAKEEVKQNSYLSSLNLNQQQSFNHRTHEADAIENNVDLNNRPSLVNYSKHNNNGNTFDTHRFASVPNLLKLNSFADNEGIVELTYKLKRPQPITFNPYYYVNFRMPYRDFVANVLTKNSDVLIDPMKLHTLRVSILRATYPNLQNSERDKASKLILNNRGNLVNAKILGSKDWKTERYLQTIRNINAKLNTKEILSFIDNVKMYNSYASVAPNTQIFRQEQNAYDVDLSNPN